MGFTGPWPPAIGVNLDWQWTIWTDATETARGVIRGEVTCEGIDFDIEPGDAVPGFVTITRETPGILHFVRVKYPHIPQSRRIEVAKKLNTHAFNVGLHTDARRDFTRKYIGTRVIDFFPNFQRDPTTQLERFQKGTAHGVVWTEEIE